MTIAAVHGHALGGGCMLAAAQDLRIADASARFGLPEVSSASRRAGASPGLVDLLGGAHARDLILTGRTIEAEEALRLGLVMRVVPAGALDGAATELAQQVAATRGAVWPRPSPPSPRSGRGRPGGETRSFAALRSGGAARDASPASSNASALAHLKGPDMTATLPLLYTHVMGSHGFPGWFWTALDKIKAGEYGQTDVRETFDDATQLAIRDQERAGIDVICDGEMRRFFFVQTFYGKMDGLEEIEPLRKTGLYAYDSVPRYRADAEDHGAQGPRHGGRVQVPQDPDRQAGQGDVPGPGDALHPHPDAARRRLRQRPPGALLGPGARRQRRAQGAGRRRRRLDPGRRAVGGHRPRPDRPST